MGEIRIQPKKIKELHAGYVEAKEQALEALDLEILKSIEVKLKKHSEFDECVWSSQGSSSRKKASVWNPELEVKSFFASTFMKPKTLLCIGHYGSTSFSRPHSSKPYRPLIMQLKDVSKTSGAFSGADSNIDALVARYCPFPIRFHEVWHKRHGKKPVWAWKPVPPSEDFVALGCVCTSTEDPPPLEIVHCVPRKWCEPSNVAVPLWDDSGTAGRRGSFWAVGNMGLLHVVQGHAAPTVGIWDFRSTKKDKKGSHYFMADELGV